MLSDAFVPKDLNWQDTADTSLSLSDAPHSVCVLRAPRLHDPSEQIGVC